ncbi:MAG: HNH endonuclease [Candidatus Eremiobacteraeota bacterium]|nr:HNH endonuclease [Candidatus Eremiobacteraeota bacterium]
MAVRRGRLRVALPEPRYNWAKVQRYYDEGHSFYDCMSRFGFCRASWHKATKRGEIKPRPLGQPLENLLLAGKSRHNIKLRLMRAGLLRNRCEECGLTEWLGEPLAIQIDHINGVRADHRLENLRMLCPNCHSQTDTYGRRPSKQPKLQENAVPV